MAGYPERVGLRLRKARYFADVNPDPAQAAKYYMQAITAAAEENMHPMDDAVIGIWIDMARFLENIGNVQQAVEVLENQRQRALDWIELHGDKEGNAGDRTRLLQKCIQIAHKIGELYTSPYCLDRKKSEEFLVWSVEMLLNENERRRKEGLKPGEGDLGVDRDQAGAQLECKYNVELLLKYKKDADQCSFGCSLRAKGQFLLRIPAIFESTDAQDEAGLS